MKQSWDDLKQGLTREVFKRGVDDVAREIPASRRTVYRLIGGETKRPSHAIREGVARVVTGGTEND